MRKSKVSQATLFQSWGRSTSNSSNPRGPNGDGVEINTSRPQNSGCGDTDQIVVIDLGNEDDDDELLAAAEEIAPIHLNDNDSSGNFWQASSSTSNSTCKHDEIETIPGFDVEAGDVWIYPTNYPVRNYQFDIVKQALFKNTLVTLPTGLGKTFIAAVVMYNFYRWYPQGKVIFMAPTKPLVAQQIEACFSIMGIPQSDTAEMTGNMAPNKRQSLWQSRRVFFLTPQVLQNDLNRGSCRAEEVVLLVADEAHKALGNHAYCQVVREIAGYTRSFRVLALSATPGDDLQAVQQVITNLLISHMELRSEESPDIQPYTHNRLVEKVVVSLGDDIARIKASYLRVLESVVGRLYCQQALWQRDPQRVTKFMLLSARDQFRKRMNEQGGLDRNQQSRIEGDFAMCISLYHAYELLLQHGILSFYNFIKGIMDGTKGMPRAKTEITKNYEFSQLMDELRGEIEPPVESSIAGNDSLLFSQFSPRRRALMNVPKPSATFKSHPKLMKLKEIVLEHFTKFQDMDVANKKGVATRVMIFSQYRDSVNEIAALLAQHKPLVRVMSFIGQQSTGKSSRGLTQKEQLQVVQRFRQGGYNTLVATCVGEEGLDIGEVDLIVCFDAHASPIRLVQRMGRTGRKRDGRIVILVTEGKEDQVYQRSQRSKKSIHKAVMQAAKSFDLYTENPRMVPRQLTPSVLRMEMTVGQFQAQCKGKKKAKPSDGANITKFTSKSAPNTSKKSDGFLTYEELTYWQEHFKLPHHEAGLSPQLSVTKRSRRSLAEAKKPVTQMSLSEWLPWQTTLHPVNLVSHSRRTEHLVELLEFTELHGASNGEDGESYDLEMMSFLNEEDILKPGEQDGANLVDDPKSTNVDDLEEAGCASSKIAKKGKSTRKKLLVDKGEMEIGTKDGRKTSRKACEDAVADATRNTKGAKKKTPSSKARWKEYLKQFDDKDEDFESDGGNVDGRPNENIRVDNEFQNQENAKVKNDFPDEGEAFQIDVTMTAQDDEWVEQEIQQPNKWNNNVKENEPEDGNVSEEGSGELSDLLLPPPTSAPLFQNLNPGFNPQLLANFGSTMVSIPTPPSLDNLDKISLSPAPEDIHEMDEQTDWNAHEEFTKTVHGKDKPFPTISAAPTAFSPACDSFVEPFLMADFLEEDDSTNAEIEGEEGVTTTASRFDKRDGCSLFSKNESSNTGVCLSTTAHGSKESDENLLMKCSKIKGEKSFTNRRVRDSRGGVKKPTDTREVTEDYEIARNEDLHAANGEDMEEKDFGFGVWCGSPSMEINQRDDVMDSIETDAGLVEAFFMDTTDDEAFTNLTLAEEDESESNVVAEKTVTIKKGRISCEGNDFEPSTDDTKLQCLKTTFETRLGKANGRTKVSVAIGLQASTRKLGAFQRKPTEQATPSTMDCNLTRDSESETRRNHAFLKEIKRSLNEESVPGEALKTLPAQVTRTRGEHSNAVIVDDDTDVLHQLRNSVAGPPVQETMSPRREKSFGLRAKQFPSKSRDGLLSREGIAELHDRANDQNLSEVRKRTEGTTENSDADGSNTGSNVENTRQTVGTNGSGISGNLNGINVKTSGNNNVGDNVCRAQLPNNKLKLSRKRSSEANSQDNCKTVNQAKSPTFLGANLLSLKCREQSFCGLNAKGFDANFSLRDTESRGSEKALEHPVPVDTVPSSSHTKGRNFCGVNTDSPQVNFSSRNTESKGRLKAHQHPVATNDTLEGSHMSVHCEGASANLSNLRTLNGTVVAVMESDDEEDDEVVIRPAKKAIPFRKRALSSPCSQEEFKRPANPGQQHNNPRRLLSSDSDEDFEVSSSVQSWSERANPHQEKHPDAQKRKVLETGAKRGTDKSLDSLRKRNNNRAQKDHFLDDEAELSGSDVNCFSSDEDEDEEGNEMDSFIDDATQLTQRTPSTTKPRHASSPADMMAVYRQSLRSPLCGSLNFKTPVFHMQRNRYKMVYKYGSVNEESGSPSEAEEANEEESLHENEVEGKDVDINGSQHENEANARKGDEGGLGAENVETKARAGMDKSFEESQIGRPVKRMKRKRILDDSFEDEVSSKLSKQSYFAEPYLKHSATDTSANISKLSRNTDTRPFRPVAPVVLRKNPINYSSETAELQSDFAKSADLLTATPTKVKSPRENRQENDWNNDISDSELLVAFETECVEDSAVQAPSNHFQDQDLKEIAVAMEMTDDDVAMEISELPTFSLGLDFLSEEIFLNSGAEEGVDSSLDSKLVFREKQSENRQQKMGDSFRSNRNELLNDQKSIRENSASDRVNNFTKIAPRSNQLSKNYRPLISNAQKESQRNASLNIPQHPVSNPRKDTPQNTHKTSTSDASLIPFDQKCNVNNNLPLTIESKGSAHGQISKRSSLAAHAKLQVVTPSCRPSVPVIKPSINPLLSSSEKDKGKTVILVDTREISSSQVVSILRLKHNIKAEVCQLTSCDYIVSNRMAVKRKSASDVACAANSPKLIECIRRMCDLYERPCLIIEKDRVRPGETDRKFIKTKAYILTLASIAQTHVKILFSDSQEDTANLLTELAGMERLKGTAIHAPVALSKEREQVFRVLLSIPQVSFITALNLCWSFNSLQEIIKSTPSDLEKRTPSLSSTRAEKVYCYLRHKLIPK
ncbi:Fanconi anemia group M protein-like [Montipora capricornis]|uniref:Fanconi anemia group M protein-like n=1 Tax=Montipora capricornis TaxID=246305 RepID=UPI0035F12E0E